MALITASDTRCKKRASSDRCRLAGRELAHCQLFDLIHERGYCFVELFVAVLCKNPLEYRGFPCPENKAVFVLNLFLHQAAGLFGLRWSSQRLGYFLACDPKYFYHVRHGDLILDPFDVRHCECCYRVSLRA